MSAEVVVLGAGVSGLAAAGRVAAAGCSVQLLEARDRVRGRIYTLRGPGWPIPVDLGAEFIQGEIPVLLELARAHALPVIELDGGRWLSRAGRLSRAENVVPRLDALLRSVSGPQPEVDRSVADFLEDPRLADLGDLARAWIEAYDAAYPSRLSLHAFQRERRAERELQGERAFRLLTGYDGVPRALEAQLPPDRVQVHLRTVATSVHWSPGQVSIETNSPDAATTRSFEAQRVVVALPLGVLQDPRETLRFDPPLLEKEDALRGLEMGNVVKIAFSFKHRFWERSIPDELGFLSAPEEPVRGWWTGYPAYEPVLIAWSAGPAADALAGLTVDQRADRALDSLARVLGLPRQAVSGEVVTWASHDWLADPFARGAYSYVRVGGMDRQAHLARPVANTLFFAGEATELAGRQATVHGAIFAGQRAADEVLGSLNAD